MTDFADLNGLYARFFALTFWLRPLLKFLMISSAAILVGVLVWHALQGLGSLMKAADEFKEHE
jgi:hypothetical protein